MKTKILLFLNTLTFLGTLFFNYFSGTGVISGKGVGDVSDKYSTLITPAGYAFSIWGFIYVLLTGYILFQWYSFYKKNDSSFIKDSGIWFIVSNIANILWIITWVNEVLFLSVLFMLLLLFSLIMLVKRNRLEVWDAPLRVMLFVWWPLSFYFGWIILATVLNISAFLYSLELGMEAGLVELSAVVVLTFAAFVYLLLIFTRYLREAAFVGIWGLIAIYFRQIEINQVVAYTAIVLSVILLVTSLIQAGMNKETLPLNKLRRKEF